MASKLLVLLSWSAAVSSIYAAGEQAPTTLFTDWLSARQKPGKASLAYYANAEVQDVCMREHSVDGCSCYGRRDKSCCWAFNVEAEMTCCNKPEVHKALDKMTEEVITTGKCTYTPMLMEAPVKINDYDDTVMKIGSFTGSCTMNKDSQTCGEPACDGMSVTIQGDILQATKVAFEGKPVHARKTETCEKLFHGDCSSGDKVAIAANDLRSYGLLGGTTTYKPYESYGRAKYEEPKYKYEEPKYEKYEPKYEKYEERKHYEEKPKYEEHKHYEEKPKYEEHKHYEEHKEEKYSSGPEEKYDEKPSYEEKRKYYAGSGMVFMGTFYTVNRLHDTKHFSGVYQSVHVMNVKDEALDAAPEGSYVARPNEVYFRFIKGDHVAEPLKV